MVTTCVTQGVAARGAPVPVLPPLVLGTSWACPQVPVPGGEKALSWLGRVLAHREHHALEKRFE